MLSLRQTPDISVFCISSAEFRRLNVTNVDQDDFDQDDQDDNTTTFVDVEKTEIPRLQRHTTNAT